jgi:uncharacterized membrane protein YhhN
MRSLLEDLGGIAGNILMFGAAPIAIAVYFFIHPRNRSRRGLFWFDVIALSFLGIAYLTLLWPIMTKPDPHEMGSGLWPVALGAVTIPILTFAALLRWLVFRHKSQSQL